MSGQGVTFTVRVAPVANDRMREHFEFLARVSEAAAIHLVDALVSDIRSLERSHFRCPLFERAGIKKGKYRFLISAKRYRVGYQVIGDTVFVDDIQDCRQDADKEKV